ncbi:MAG: ABC transporter ATP-binding protein [Pikeienuella sp.]
MAVEDLTVAFGRDAGRITAVDRVSFEIPPGGAYGLVGESGSGKSTVLRAIAGLVPAAGGRISLGGIALGARRNMGFYRSVQMVFQDPYGALHPRHTVDRTLAEPARLHRRGDTDARIDAVLEQVGLGHGFRFRYPHQLSGGQRQRVAIARALMLEPKILLLDEPTSALDVSVQAEVLNLLSDLRRERGLTYLMVSHDLAVVAHMCERIAVMRGGQILDTLTVDELRRAEPSHAYTADLNAASRGYSAEESPRETAQ